VRGVDVRQPRRVVSAGALAILLLLAGCTRRYYRNFADADVYRIEDERQFDWRWTVPPRPVEAQPNSRIGDKHDPDREPIPPDDPAARPFQVSAGRPFEFHGWKKRGTAPVEDLTWLSCLPRGSDGAVLLGSASAMQIALANSRDYQTNVENVYLQALSLTLSRFSFFPQLFSTQTTQYRHFGANKNDSNQLQLFAQNSLNWTFYSGANLLVNFANSLIFEYNGRGFQAVNSGLAVSLTQPLLRGAWARNVTQPLSLVERQTLYTVRDFASYRRTFYVTVVSNYLQLLTQVQQIRNQQNNVQALKRSLDEYEALVQANISSPLERDTIANQYLNARQLLLGQEAQFQTALDLYRVQLLGLPADFPLKIDETLLTQFELNDPRLDTLRRENDALYLSLLQYDRPPGRGVMADAARKVKTQFAQLDAVTRLVSAELARWRARIAAETGKAGTGPGQTEQDERESFKRQVRLAGELAVAFETARGALADNLENTDEFLEKLDRTDPQVAWRVLRQELVGRDLRARLSELFVIQTQVRVYLIELNRVELTVEQAVSTALANRLDLMNNLGRVTDTWRNVEFAGNQLLAGLNLFYQGNLNTDPRHKAVLGFDAHDSQHVAGIRFDAPIVRRGERNTYRADQIAFQRARRQYMLNHDEIVRTVRLDMRQLNLDRRVFEIGREQLLVTARLVDQAEYKARTGSSAEAGGQSTGLYLLQALGGLLDARNRLIQSWISYETQRLTLYRDFDLMNIDARGVWTNDGNLSSGDRGPAPAPAPVGAAPESLLPPPIPATPGPFARP